MLPGYKDIFELIKAGSTIEAQEKIMELRQTALEIQEENLNLRERIRQLEEQLKTKEDWETEKLRYALVSLHHGEAQVYALRETKAQGEAPHYLCPNCFQYRTKVLLNSKTNGMKLLLNCPKCGSTTETGFSSLGQAEYAEHHM